MSYSISFPVGEHSVIFDIFGKGVVKHENGKFKAIPDVGYEFEWMAVDGHYKYINEIPADTYQNVVVMFRQKEPVRYTNYYDSCSNYAESTASNEVDI